MLLLGSFAIILGSEYKSMGKSIIIVHIVFKNCAHHNLEK